MVTCVLFDCSWFELMCCCCCVVVSDAGDVGSESVKRSCSWSRLFFSFQMVGFVAWLHFRHESRLFRGSLLPIDVPPAWYNFVIYVKLHCNSNFNAPPCLYRDQRNRLMFPNFTIHSECKRPLSTTAFSHEFIQLETRDTQILYLSTDRSASLLSSRKVRSS